MFFKESHADVIIIGHCIREMRTRGVSEETIENFLREATSGSYENFVKVCKEYEVV